MNEEMRNCEAEEGESRNMPECQGTLVKSDHLGGCSCHINPPCSYCTSGLHCNSCDWEGEDA